MRKVSVLDLLPATLQPPPAMKIDKNDEQTKLDG
jgi:hypothetical protein